MTATAVVIPFRDRGTDTLRKQNLECVVDHWWQEHGERAHVVSDGRSGAAPFNRSAAYNRAIAELNADVYVFTESDMLISPGQIEAAVAMTQQRDAGLIIPFIAYHYLGERNSGLVRSGAEPANLEPDRIISGGRSIGAINVVSRTALLRVGWWDESFEGAWFDDDAMKIAFEMCAGATTWVQGCAWHLHHLSSGSGAHLSADDRAATARNRARCELYRQARTPEQIRKLTRGEA